MLADKTKKRRGNGIWLSPLRIALIYLFLSVLWIFYSDRFLVAIGVENITYWQTLKGWAFVSLSAGLIYYLTQRLSQSLQAALKKSQAAHRALEELNRELNDRVSAGIERERQSEQMIIEQARLLALGETLRLIAHHWRQPLTCIALAVQELEEAHEHGELDSAYLARTSRETMATLERLSQTINNFIHFFPSSDRWQAFNLHQSAQEALTIGEGILKEHAIAIDFTPEAPQEQMVVEGYRGAFNQTLSSVLNNAREAILEARSAGRLDAQSAQIRLITRREERWAVLEVFNHGDPISDENLSRLFDPYFSTKGPATGTGLSLFAAKIVIEKHMNGKLRALNRPDGVSFLFYLPARQH